MSPISAVPKRDKSTVKAPAKESRPRHDAAKAARARLLTAGQRLPLRQFLREVWSELHKVRWPTQTELRNLTLVVLALSAAVGLFLGLIDFVFAEFFKLLLQVVGSGGF